jgi:hypothetical protein
MYALEYLRHVARRSSVCYAKRGFIGTVISDCAIQIELDATYQGFGFPASQPPES